MPELNRAFETCRPPDSEVKFDTVKSYTKQYSSPGYTATISESRDSNGKLYVCINEFSGKVQWYCLPGT